jgi:alpha-ribazole phosphatase
MRTIYLIRHGKTKGNEERRYVGRTDEPLSESAFQELEKRRRAIEAHLTQAGQTMPGIVYVSPMLRCRQTAQCLFPTAEQSVIPDFREKDFGAFEYKNYEELTGDSRYQAFIDSGGRLDFPDAEPQKDFLQRVDRAFVRCMEDVSSREEAFSAEEPLVFVVHGGTIMSILDQYAFPHRDYFDWQLQPLGCFAGKLLEKQGIFRIEDIRKL